MICKKDTEVEVLEKGEEPLESWRPARILSGNGHYYVVKFDSCPLEAPAITNKVPRKALRPRPPPVEVKSWACADLAEVCYDGSWKLAEVLRNLDLNMVVARLMGSSKEIVTPFPKLRLPQIWKDNHWIPLQKESVNCKNVGVNAAPERRKTSSRIPSSSVVDRKGKQIDRCAEKYDDSVDQRHLKSLGGLKRKSRECNPPVHPHVGKEKRIKKRGRCDELTEKKLTNQPFEKVDAVNSPQNFYGEEHMNSAFYHETIGFGQIGLDCQNPIADAGPNPVVSLDRLDNESTATTASSVDSCSVINGLCRSLHHKTSKRKKLRDHIDDAESFCGSPTHFRDDEVAEEIHRLELDAYRSTLRSLFSSGSLSWDQESLLTNLRFALNISNDEHLSEIKNLILTRS